MAKQVLEHIDSLQSPSLIVRSAILSSSNCSSDAVTSRPAKSTESAAALTRQEDVETLNTIWRDLLQDHPRHVFLQVPPLPPARGTSADAGAVMLKTDRYLESPPQSHPLEQKSKLKMTPFPATPSE
ncbi:hypothetical protein C6P46_003591 [Rhodotorula mucilaginosa]|uniref:Uncharacterized protein n=1 Tax=Rhodotorula mucilaginosa TaxID=5537 RepID=A0A9P7BAA6_RHOMI|nr:hypothetical protein C6P46_003591 [Rhodotorula mucilaginosa]